MKFSRVLAFCLLGVLAVVAVSGSKADDDKKLVEPFSKLVGDTKVGKVETTDPTPLPYLTWGGDVATFHGNGGLTTVKDSVFAKQGLNFKLTNGDNFVQQVKDYMSGKTPYLRGTFTMIGQASEVLNSDPATKPVTILQLTWSAGDHMVGRAEVKNLNDLKGKTVCLQQGGPHVGLVDDALRASGLKWSDVKVKWVKDLSGKDGPSEAFKADKSIDLCCVISPDMIGLTGGLDQKGSGAEGTVKGAHVVVSTASMSHSIADVYCVRADYFKDNRAKVEKFVAGYIKATDELVAMKKKYADGKGKSPEYISVLKMTQKIYGEKVLPTIEVDAHGLVSDASFVGLPGNVSFFTDAGNLNGFSPKLKTTLDLVTTLGYAKERSGWDYARWDYEKLAKQAGVEYVAPKAVTGRIKGEGVDLFPKDNLDERTILSFTITFEPNQTDFSPDTYAAEFKRVVQNTQTFGNAVILIRGHSDPTKTLVDFLKAGMKKGTVTREGDAKSGWKYKLDGKDLDLTATGTVMAAITKGDFAGSDPNPQETMQAALNLSQTRAEAVKKAIASYAKTNKINLDVSQVQPVGVGIREPLVAKPSNMDEAKRNMRVEFRLIRVSPENIKPSDFDY
jgi:ABC-type nitrate/sulfonate/bicarbonate transport system substrate-binding protein/outer membrane protein OmpA-like peptidoglycan-associated protein